ncbi:cytochrome c oxidase assembly factor Coa1 family protein [Telmatobacter sp. DSM 110680]|uniref:Cytochrome c oxidase assembly factor Coa1 family protein n=1 Tax=Telmatobacter sp. DSM 110680 TaxID=3036704 RepID=A0AAU7DJQ3_9BACT
MTEQRVCKILIAMMFINLLCVASVPALHESRAVTKILWLLIGGIIAGILYIRFNVSIKRRVGILSIGWGRAMIWMMLAFPAWFLPFFIVFDFEERRSSTCQEAVRELHESEMAKGLFGDSIQIGWPVEGQAGWDQKDLLIPVDGNRGSGWLRVVSTKTDGVWKNEQLVITSLDGKIHEDILNTTPSPQQR